MAGLGPAAATPPPSTGWLRAVREGLGITAAQLARRLGFSTATVLQMEKRETEGKVTLEVLERAARALGCRLVYAIVPDGEESFEAMVDAQALRAARRLSLRAAQSMRLEKQEVSEDETEAQVKDLARALKDKMSTTMWDE